jgi:hypothetical protein
VLALAELAILRSVLWASPCTVYHVDGQQWFGWSRAGCGIFLGEVQGSFPEVGNRFQVASVAKALDGIVPQSLQQAFKSYNEL